MTDYSPAELDTLALHAGGKPDPATGARASDLSDRFLLFPGFRLRSRIVQHGAARARVFSA